MPSGLRAQAHDIRFEQYFLEEGLSQSIVHCITQDNTGFMWFGTEDGLNKFDGYEFKVIRHDPNDTTSIAYNHIISLYTDRSGVLWIGTFLRGLDRFDPERGQFIHLRHDPDDPASLSHDMVRAIFEDRSGALWVGTDDGLNRFDPQTESFTRYVHDPDDPGSISNNMIKAICEDQAGALWIGTDGGLNRFDRETETFTCYLHYPGDPRSISHNEVRALYVDASGLLWVGTNGGGLNRFDIETKRFTRYPADPDDPATLSHNSVFAIHEDRTSTLWIGTNGGGLNRFDRKNERFIRYVYDPNDPSSISYNEVYAIFEDRSGVIWIGTYGGGIDKFDTKRKKFAHYRARPNDPNSLSHPIVWSIYEDYDGMLWIGTHGGGLNRLDRERNRYTHYRHDPVDPQSLSNDIVRVVYPDRRSGDLWIGTNGGGICRFDRNAGTFKTYRHDTSDPHSISHDEIRSMYEDREGNLWIGTNGGGFNKLDRASGTFKRYQHDPENPQGLSNNFVRFFFEDSGGNFWLGTQGGGLNLFDRVSETFTHYRQDPQDASSISSDFIFSMLEDKNGMFWLGTWGGGLVKFDFETNTFTTFTEEDGLPSNSVYGALLDNDGNLWLSTNYGLSRFDPETESFKNYSERDGLQGNEFNGNSFFKSDKGEMFFGGIKGFNAFYPAEIEDNPHIPPVVITSFKKFNKEVNLDRPISKLEELELSYRDYIFSFDFAALEYSATDKNQYAYKMEGLDEDWIYTNAEKRSASYTTLPSGNYTFKVKASNNDGIWNEEGVSIRLLITPPFWNAWWFRLLIIAVVLGLGIFLYRRRVSTVRMKTELQSAHDAQMAIMPQTDPEIKGFQISGICLPANEVGGDFYDYFWMNDEETILGVAVGDVSGKAMQAAMIAVMSSGMISSRADEASSPKDVLTLINRSVHRKTGPTMFTALCFALIDTMTKELTYTIAGFNEPLLRSGDSVTNLEGAGHGLPLGALKESRYREDTVQLRTGDVLLLYTDGVTEARRSEEEFYEEERLTDLLRSTDTTTLSAKEIKDRIVTDVRKFTGNIQQEDDMTIVVIKVV